MYTTICVFVLPPVLSCCNILSPSLVLYLILSMFQRNVITACCFLSFVYSFTELLHFRGGNTARDCRDARQKRSIVIYCKLDCHRQRICVHLLVIIKLGPNFILDSHHPSIFGPDLHSQGYEPSEALHICKQQSGYVSTVGLEPKEN